MNLAGSSAADVRIWNTYLFWARSALRSPLSPGLEMAKRPNRLDATRANALQAIVFAAFALEYRIKRINEELNISSPAKETLGGLLSQFQTRVESKSRIDNGRPIVLPKEWPRLFIRLEGLRDLRNNIAHAKFAELRTMLGTTPSAIDRTAARGYNAVIDFLRVASQSIGYETLKGRAARDYYRQLRVKS